MKLASFKCLVNYGLFTLQMLRPFWQFPFFSCDACGEDIFSFSSTVLSLVYYLFSQWVRRNV